MHNPASVLENDTHKLQWDFDIQKDPSHLGQKTRPYNKVKLATVVEGNQKAPFFNSYYTDV